MIQASMRVFLISLLFASFSFADKPLGHRIVEHEGAQYHIYEVPSHQLKLRWKNPKGQPFRTFAFLQSQLQQEGKRPLLLMNAGIFEPQGIPSGLHLENKKTLLPLNPRKGHGNFYLKPNGVLLWNQIGAHIYSTAEHDVEHTRFIADTKEEAHFGLQSGPLLLREGKVHHAFREKSESKKYRNGVGVKDGKTLIFAINTKDSRTNLYHFSTLFRSLGCSDALFLDGDISSHTYQPTKAAHSSALAAIFVVLEESQTP